MFFFPFSKAPKNIDCAEEAGQRKGNRPRARTPDEKCASSPFPCITFIPFACLLTTIDSATGDELVNVLDVPAALSRSARALPNSFLERDHHFAFFFLVCAQLVAADAGPQS